MTTILRVIAQLPATIYQGVCITIAKSLAGFKVSLNFSGQPQFANEPPGSYALVWRSDTNTWMLVPLQPLAGLYVPTYYIYGF